MQPGQNPPGACVERSRTDAKAEGDVVVIGLFQTRNNQGKEIRHEQGRALHDHRILGAIGNTHEGDAPFERR